MKIYRDLTGSQVSTGNFYRELQRLAGEHLVLMVARSEGADSRQAPYAITQDGIALFDKWIAHPVGLADVGTQDDQLSARIPFLSTVDPEIARQLIRQW